MKSLLSWILAALVALVLIAATDGGGAEAAADPYWVTCGALADSDALEDTAVALTERAGLPALSSAHMAGALADACDSRSAHYRPGLDAVRSTLRVAQN